MSVLWKNFSASEEREKSLKREETGENLPHTCQIFSVRHMGRKIPLLKEVAQQDSVTVINKTTTPKVEIHK